MSNRHAKVFTYSIFLAFILFSMLPVMPVRAASCTLRIFFRHQDSGKNVDEGSVGTIKVGETKYHVVGKIDNPGCDTSYWIRMTASDEKGQFPDNPVVGPLHPQVGKEYSITPNFSKEGKYLFYLDYAKDNEFKEAKQNTPALTATVTVAGPTNSGPYVPPAGPNVSATAPPGGYDKEYGGLENLIPASTIPQFMASLVKLFIAALGVWAVVHILVSSYRIVMSQGNTEALTKAKNGIIWAVVGLAVAVLAYSIVAILQTVLGV
jgi:type IV secretion system pilin